VHHQRSGGRGQSPGQRHRVGDVVHRHHVHDDPLRGRQRARSPGLRAAGPDGVRWRRGHERRDRRQHRSGQQLATTGSVGPGGGPYGPPPGPFSGAAAVASRAMDLELSDEQRLIQETAREFTDKEIVPRARENDRNHHFDLELIAQMAEQGYLGAIVPREYGGAGLDYLTYGLIVEPVGRGDSAMRTVVSVQTPLVCPAILRWGTEEQKQQYLPKLCSGEWLGCFALTEPDTGSDAANQKSRARKSDGGWVINGSKMFISLGNHAKVALVFAQTDPEKAHRGVACFLVDTDQPGFKPQEIHHKMGLRGSDTAEISLDDVECRDEDLLGDVA